MRNTRLMTVSICAVLLGAMTAFHVYGETSSSSSAAETASITSSAEVSVSEEIQEVTESDDEAAVYKVTGTGSSSASGSSALDTTDLFSNRDLAQTADLTGSEKISQAQIRLQML